MKKFIFLLILFSLQTVVYTEDNPYSGEVIFFNEGVESENEREEIYSLKIRGASYSFGYPVINENGRYYFPVMEFFKTINFKNFTLKDGELIMYLGTDAQKETIDFENMSKAKCIKENNDYYLREDIFKKYFAEEIRIEKQDFSINLVPSFTLPKEIGLMVDATARELQEQAEKPLLLYTSKRELIGAGNLRVNLEQEINHNSDSNKKRDWNGFLEYEGPLLYGDFYTYYDLKDKKFGDARLTYYDLLPGYELELGIYGERREKGLRFQKSNGFYEGVDGDYIISEQVPLGSRVELLFNGIPIDIKNEENGRVTFTNSLMKAGREFTLRIYLQNGEIQTRTIKLTEDYNQQKANQFGYDIYMREDKESHKVDTDLNIYYGVTNNLTLGVGYSQLPEFFNDDYIYLKEFKTELIYSNTIFNNPYTFTYTLEKNLNDEKDEKADYSKKYSNQFMIDTNIGPDLSVNYEHIENGPYFDTKREDYLELDYDLTNWLSLTYDLEKLKYRTNTSDSETDYNYGVELNNSWNSMLVTYNYRNNIKGEDEHELDLYYTGFKYVITKLTNKLEHNGNYEVELKVDNKSYSDKYNYSFGVKYDSKNKDIYTFGFEIKFDNWLEIGSNFEKDSKNNRSYIGIDRVLNLKKPLANMGSLDSSVLKVIAFLDNNNNNILDKGEEKLEGVSVSLGENNVITNSKGIGYIYGFPSFAETTLKVETNRPSLKADATRIKVKSTGASNIIAMIPVKPMISLNGNVDLSKHKDLLEYLTVKLKNLKTNKTMTTNIEYDGFFYFSDIMSGKYELQIIDEEENKVYYQNTLELKYTNENGGDNVINLAL